MMTNKTGKREIALAFTAILVYEIYLNNTDMVDIIIWPIMSFVAASAGLHIYGQSTKTTRSTSTDDSLQSP